MCRQYVVLTFLTMVSTTNVMAASLNCTFDNTDCILLDVRTDENNDIVFPQTFNRALAQSLTKIEIKQSKFSKFPSNFFKVMPNVEFLRARNCGLETLNASIFGSRPMYSLTGIDTLDLEYNLVETLEAHTFQQTKNLIKLDLSGNLLFHIDALAFDGLKHLQFLILTNNQLAFLNQLVFTPLVSLLQLFLGDNQLKILNLDIFRNNVNLDILSLAKNKLVTLQATLTNNAADYIDLSGNQLVDISALRKMKGMHTLILSGNKEVDLVADDFAAMAGLNLLNIDDVDLQRRLSNNYQFLKPLRHLYTLSIGSNNLTSLSQLSHPMISKLIVDGNKIGDLDVNALKVQIPRLNEINIDNNPWNCQVLTKVLDQLLKSRIKLRFRIDRRPLQAGRKSVETIGCTGEDAKLSSEVNGDTKDYDVDERIKDDLVCGRPTLPGSQYIYGGQKTIKGAWPWLVAVHKQSDGKVEFLCGGSLISNKLVVSAAHCLIDLSLRQALLYIGSHDIRNMRDTDFQQRGAQQLVIHPDYFRQDKAFSDADIGLIILLQPVIYTDTIKPICLWPTDEADQNIVGQKGVVAGWGFDSSDQGTATPNYVEMPLVSTLSCLYDDPSYRKITSNRTLCVGEKNGQGPCHGDSGGGFVMKRAEKWVLRGVVSAGLPDIIKHTCDLTKYVVLSDTVKFTDWIRLYLKI